VNRLFICAALFVPMANAQLDDATKQLSHDIFKQLIDINTTDSVGSVTAAAEAMAQRFRDAGFADDDIRIGGPNDRKKNVVVRLHGSGKHKPVLLIGHLDVVEAHREDWTTDPFQFAEKDGYFYGRGTQDMKDGDAVMTTTLIRFKKEGFVPDRDIILALTADEEGGASNGVDWLLKNHRDWIDADFVLNLDENSVVTDHGKPLFFEFDAGEKTYSDYRLLVTDPGGHSSLPRPRNPIYKLANALSRLQQYQFPVQLNEVTRAYYKILAGAEGGKRGEDMKAVLRDPADLMAAARLSEQPLDNATLHTTCVATRVSAGHANNALPQRAEAVVNCRILPGHTKQEIRETLVRVVNDPEISVMYLDSAGTASASPPGNPVFQPYPVRQDVFGAAEKVAAQMWPGMPVIPFMAQGASDGIFTSAAGMPTYCFSGVAVERDDKREHGKDERIPADSFYRGVEFQYRFLKLLTSSM